MLTKVMIEPDYGSYKYMVYRFVDNKWEAVQFFNCRERQKAIDFAKDLSAVADGKDEATVVSFGE